MTIQLTVEAKAGPPASWKPAVELVCPNCRAALAFRRGILDCAQCGRVYKFQGEFPDLVVGNRFDDPESLAKIAYEERSNADLTLNYLVPLFRQLWPNLKRPPRLLSLGCGTGVDIDLLTDQGFDCIGIDCGNRSRAWEWRRQKSRLFIADGRHLPFADGSFDAVFCGCVFPHVGVIGDSSQVSGTYSEDRLALAAEMSRVLDHDGKALVSSPNRLFPLDLFHGRAEGSMKPRFNSPHNPFLLSVSDYKKLFGSVGFNRVRPLSVRNYWGFIRSRKSLKGRLLGMPVRALFACATVVPILRNSPLNPWLVVLIERSP